MPQLKGVPLRCEFGPRDLASGQAVLVRRDTREKVVVPLAELPQRAQALLDAIQAGLLAAATKKRNESIATVTKWEQFVPALDELKMIIAPWCDAIRPAPILRSGDAPRYSASEERECA